MKRENMIIGILIVCLVITIVMGSIHDNLKKEKIDTSNTNEYTEKDKNKMVYIYKFDEYPDINIPYIDLNNNSNEIMKINNRIKEVMLSGSAQYKYYINKDILTLIITKNDKIIETYNINIKTRKLMTFEEICEYKKINYSDMKKYIVFKLKEQKGDEVLLTTSYSYSYIYYTLYENKNYYIDENNRLNIILNEENIVVDDISVPGDNDQETLDLIVENELYLLGGKKNISEITNKEKVWYAYNLSGGFRTNPLETTDAKKLRNAFSSSSLSNLEIEMDDIYHSGENVLLCHEYSEKSDKFTDVGCHFGIHSAKAIYVKTSDYIKEDNKYTISAKYIWHWQNESGLRVFYGSYDDAKNQTNPIYEVPEGKNTFTYEEMNKIIENNSIETYNFTFEKQNNNFKLIDFYVTR